MRNTARVHTPGPFRSFFAPFQREQHKQQQSRPLRHATAIPTQRTQSPEPRQRSERGEARKAGDAPQHWGHWTGRLERIARAVENERRRKPSASRQNISFSLDTSAGLIYLLPSWTEGREALWGSNRLCVGPVSERVPPALGKVLSAAPAACHRLGRIGRERALPDNLK